MGISSGSLSINQYFVKGGDDVGKTAEWLAGRLAAAGFLPIDDTADEKSEGFCCVDDINDSAFKNSGSFFRPPYACFSLRSDERKVPRAVARNRTEQECARWLAENPEYNRVPKGQKEELEELIHKSLLGKTLAVPSLFDVVWNTQTDVLFVTVLSRKKLDAFEELFKKVFDGLSLAAVHPYARAGLLLDDEGKKALERLNQAGSDNALDLIQDNLWIGRDFLLWLLYQSVEVAAEFKVNRPGPLDVGAPFVAYIDSKVVMTGEEAEGKQRFTTTGPQALFSEVRTALRGGKQIAEATLFFERGEEEVWKMTLKGEGFQFGSLRTPKFYIDRDELDGKEQEQEASFYERMNLVESGLQMFDSLFSDFLAERLAGEWAEKLEAIDNWCRAG